MSKINLKLGWLIWSIALSLTLSTLQLVGLINWSWWVIFTPVIFSSFLYLLTLLCILLIFIFKGFKLWFVK